MMNISSAIVECEPGQCKAVIRGLASLAEVSVYGFQDPNIVIVLESTSAAELESLALRIQELEGVVGFSPVFSADE